MPAAKASIPKAANSRSASRNRTLRLLRISLPATIRPATILRASATIARRAATAATTAAGTVVEIAGAADAVGVLDGVAAAVAVAVATGIGVRTDRAAAAATCLLRNMRLRRALAKIEADLTIGLRTIAAPALRSKNAMTTSFCRANRWRNIARGPYPRRSSRWAITNRKNVSRIMNRPPRVPRLACNPAPERPAASPAACRTGF